MFFLGALALALVATLFSIDHYLNSAGFQDPISHYLSFSDEAVSNSIGVLSSIIAAVLGMIITVVSIVVQLAATRYTPAVTEIFFRDRTNMVVMAIYVIGCVMGFWIAFGVNSAWVPRVSLLVMLSMATLGFILMAPFFAHVFRILTPQSFVARIQRDAEIAAIGEDGLPNTATAIERQDRVLTSTEQLTDIAINSISQKDRIIAVACVDALRDLTCAYLGRKKELGEKWFEIGRNIKHNPDFSSMAKHSISDLQTSNTWFEFKVLRQYPSIYTEALGSMRNINYVIAINTRLIAEQALQSGDMETLKLAVKFYNTYLRATLNQNDVRTAYTILNHYRHMAETLLRAGEGEMAVRIAGHIKYYGHVSYQKRLGFVTETVAYDVGALCEVAHEHSSDVELELLQLFLETDPTTSEGDVQETSLRGVRKAQLKLATFYLANEAEELARKVWEDMRDEKPERLRSIRDELLAVESKDFWEISDRGGNFDYLSPERKDMLRLFFGWFRDVSGLKTVSLDAPGGAEA